MSDLSEAWDRYSATQGAHPKIRRRVVADFHRAQFAAELETIEKRVTTGQVCLAEYDPDESDPHRYIFCHRRAGHGGFHVDHGMKKKWRKHHE